ncbi:MAG: glycosyltransferase family 9 protein [Deltaproteobacteria bacterium]|nr:glycosyltransferase family 9 protein [Deltaproteobacteria bacterium]
MTDAALSRTPPAVPHTALRRVAVLETAYVGDVVMTSVLARSIRRAVPGVAVALIARSGPSQLAPGLGFHQVLKFDKRSLDSGWRGIEKLARQLTAEGFDALIVPHRSARSALVAWRSKISIRVGYAGPRLGIPLSGALTRAAFTHTVPFGGAGTTFTGRLLELLEPLGVPASERRPRYRTSVDAKKSISDLLSEHPIGAGGLVALAPGSVWPTKRWPLAHWARLADALVEDGATPVVLGGEGERARFDQIRRAAAAGSQIVDGIGTTLDQAAELMRRSGVLVAGDTGLLHLGLAVETPAVALFGPTDPGQHDWPKGTQVVALGLACQPCSEHGHDQCPEKHHRCMQELPPGQVISVVRRALQAAGAGEKP